MRGYVLKNLAFVMVLATSLCHQQAAAFTGTGYGRFEGELHLKAMRGTNKMRLLQDYAYIDPSGKRWLAPAGYESDGASIPKAVWSLVGDPWGANYRDAAVIHDVACDEATERWRAVHLAFYHAMLAAGVQPSKAKLMYAAVYHFGPRWTLTSTGRTRSATPILNQQRLKKLAADVRKIEATRGAENAQLDDIEALNP